MNQLKRHVALPVILLAFTILTLLQSIALPLGEAADETDHYQYHRFVARTGRPPLTGAEREAAGFKGGLAPLYYWLTAWPVAWVGESSLPDIRRTDSRPERYIPNDGLGINHVLHTLDEQWPWQGQPLAWHIVRLLSLPLGWITIIATYALARRIAPQPGLIAAGAAGFVAFLPRFVISSAVINDDNLVIALTALLLLVQVIILQRADVQNFEISDKSEVIRKPPVSAKLMAIFGVLFGLTLVTKYFSLSLIPEILFTLFIATHSVAARTSLPARRLDAALLSFFIALFATAGVWFIFITARFNRVEELGFIAGLAASLGEPQITGGLLGLLSGNSLPSTAATYALPAWLSLLYRSFWFEFGWMNIFAPAWVYLLFSLFSVLVVVGIVIKLKSRSSAEPLFTAARILLALHLLLFLVVVFTRYILSATIDTGQGRHLFPALPVIALLASIGMAAVAAWLSRRPVNSVRFLAIYGSLVTVTFLWPALATLRISLTFEQGYWRLQTVDFIARQYQTLPVTIAPVALPAQQRLNLSSNDGPALLGYRANPTARAGSAWPVTLYWHTPDEVNRDYLVSLCLYDAAQRPVACQRSHFVDGAYPARAWEAGDTVIDTMYLPIPTCYRLPDATYSLHIELWPLEPTSSSTTPADAPVLQVDVANFPITIEPTASLSNQPQRADIWQGQRRLQSATSVGLRQSLAVVSYAAAGQPGPEFRHTSQPNSVWAALPQFDTPLSLPCDDGPEPFATVSHFITRPDQANGSYTGPQLPELVVTMRDRIIAPLTGTLSFSNTVSIINVGIPMKQATEREAMTIAAYQLPLTHLPLKIRWQARRWMADPLVAALKLVDKDFAIGGERVATLGDRYPNVLWSPGELFEETYPIRLAPDTPPGLYRLEVGLLRQDAALPSGYEQYPLMGEGESVGDNLYPLTIRLLDPAHNTSPPVPFLAQLGEAIQLRGYEVNPAGPDSPDTVQLALHWQSTAPIPGEYTVFTQLLGPDGQVWAQWDNPPQAGRYPTSAWSATDTVVDRYTLWLREGAPAGDYRLLVGMYDATTGQRLPVTINGQPQPDNAVQLTTLSLD